MLAIRDFVIGTAGHIDHGKTALVRALTGTDPDRLPAERQRGITIDLGFAALELGNLRVALVDVPGHERFVRNMLAGATGLDLAMLVVAADDSVMPQTREHLEILRILGLSGGLVALTKCDLADPSWVELVEEEIRTLTRGTFLEDAPIVRTSAATGAGMAELTAEIAKICNNAPGRDDPGPFRMAIDRSFTVPGHGTVVTGTVASGKVAVGDDLEWLPEGRTVRVRGLHRHDRPIEEIARGARAAINVGGVHHSEIRRGQELGTPGYLEAARVLSVEVRASTDAARPLKHGARYRLHLGTGEVAARLSLAGVKELGASESSLGQLFLAEPVVAVHGEPFVLRAESPVATLGGGRVLQPAARRVRRRDAGGWARVEQLRSPDPLARARVALAGFGLSAWSELQLCRETGIPLREIPQAIAGLTAAGALVELPIGPRRTVRVAAELAAELEGRVVRALGRLHAANPRRTAIRRTHMLAALPDLPGDTLVAGLINRLHRAGVIVADARTMALCGFEPKLSQAERRLKDQIAAALRDGGFKPPDAGELQAMAGARAAVLPELLSLLVDEGQVVELGHGLYLDADREAEMRTLVRERLEDGSAVTMAEIRDLLGTTRKFAVPIGEYLDRIGLTVREGDLRRLGRDAAG